MGRTGVVAPGGRTGHERGVTHHRRGPVGAPTSTGAARRTIVHTPKNTSDGRSSRSARPDERPSSLPGLRGVERHDVREPADEEEDRHDLQHPGREPQPGRRPDRAGGPDHPVVPPDEPDRPMADDDRQMLAARRKSTTRSRDAGVASTSVSREAALTVHDVPRRVRRVKQWAAATRTDRMGGCVQAKLGSCSGWRWCLPASSRPSPGLRSCCSSARTGSIGVPPTRIVAAGSAITLPQLDVPTLPRRASVVLDVALTPGDRPMFVG